VDGQCWHYLRRHWGVMGFIVDIVRNEPQPAQAVRDFVHATFEATAVPSVASTGSETSGTVIVSSFTPSEQATPNPTQTPEGQSSEAPA
jgi:hypothetical protein